MKDAINCAHGYGCHCRNCEFKTEYKFGENETMWRCIQGILRPEHMNYKSFCSAGVPKQNNEFRVVKCKDIEEVAHMLRYELTVSDATHVSVKIELKNGRSVFVSVDKYSHDLKFYGIEKCDAPAELRKHMRDSRDAYDTIRDDELAIALKHEIKSIGEIKAWKC